MASRFLIATAFAGASLVAAQTPLADLRFSYPDGMPYQADTNGGPRGTQQGYNRCNSTTEGPTSMCQTFFTTSISDFCLFGPPVQNETVGNDEGEMVAWCTKAGRGTRLIPDGALQGVQFIQTPSYISITGFIDQQQINLLSDDAGGELDPHGADQRGNPLGGLMYSQHWNNGAWTQVTQWHAFMGGNYFCMKACRPGGGDSDRLCENRFDRIGCAYNVPSAIQNGTFTSCEGADQLPPGIYVQNGATMTYQQPPESLGPIATIPYQPQVPASSQCTTHTSASLYTDAARIAAASSSSAASRSASAHPTSAGATGASASRSGASASGPAATAPSSSSGAMRTGSGEAVVGLASIVVAVMAVLGAALAL